MTYPKILPGQTIGILGGGQLGQMMALAGKAMGYKFISLDPGAACPAAQVADEHIQAAYNDLEAGRELANKSQVITYEFENIDACLVEDLEKDFLLPQGSAILRLIQNRITEKTTLRSFALPVASHAVISKSLLTVADHDPNFDFDYSSEKEEHDRKELLERAVERLELPLVMKTAVGGYDGKGQWVLRTQSDVDAAMAVFDEPAYADADFVVEKLIDFTCELSVIVARNIRGDVEVYPLAENEHTNNILHKSIVPARVPDNVRDRIHRLAIDLAENIKLVGVMGIELFYQESGLIYINEIAPRPHNSGHYTMDACETSQFEQHIRAICNLPLGETSQQSPVVMVNLLGQHMEEFMAKVHDLPSAMKFHLYGKAEAIHNRKMGHINVLADTVEEALALVDEHLNFIK